MLRTTAREAEPAEMVEGMVGSKSQQRQINDRIPLSALGTEQPDLLEEERGHTLELTCKAAYTKQILCQQL